VCLYVGYSGKVIVCGEVFESSQVRTKKVDADQDAAKLAFEQLKQRDMQNDDTYAASKNVIWIMLINGYNVESGICLPV